VRNTRVIYVENDPALRGIMTRSLRSAEGIDLLLETGSARDALAAPEILLADVALLDLALGADELNGIDLGLGLRQRNSDIGIVVYSQYSMRNLARRVPEAQRIGWSFIPKTGDMRTEDMVSVLRATARGISHDRADSVVAGAGEQSLLEQLSDRQRAIMALAATGLTAPEISVRLGASHDAVRKELSRLYRILVPEAAGGDLRTLAVLAYLQLVRDSSWDGLES
jgi:two-component system response regulator DesR